MTLNDLWSTNYLELYVSALDDIDCLFCAIQMRVLID